MKPSVPVLAPLLASALLLAACETSSGAGGGAALPGVESTTTSAEPSDATTTPDPPPTAPPATSAPTSAPSSTDPPTTTVPASTAPATPAPSTTAPADAPRQPTTGVTAAHIGTDGGGAWLPLAIWTGTEWGEVGYDEDDNVIPTPEPSFDTVAVASLGLPEPVTGLTYGPVEQGCADDLVVGPTIDLPVALGEIGGAGGYEAVSVAADWELQPRPVSQVGLDSEVYQQIGEDIVRAAGFDPAGGDVVQVVRADLDGNGIEEVLMTFEKSTEGFGTVGDFSIVLVRFPAADGSVVDELLFEYYPEEPVDFPTIGGAGWMAVADLNGDGAMEVMMRAEFWESRVVELFEYHGGTELTSVGFNGCSI